MGNRNNDYPINYSILGLTNNSYHRNYITARSDNFLASNRDFTSDDYEVFF